MLDLRSVLNTFSAGLRSRVDSYSRGHDQHTLPLVDPGPTHACSELQGGILSPLLLQPGSHLDTSFRYGTTAGGTGKQAHLSAFALEALHVTLETIKQPGREQGDGLRQGHCTDLHAVVLCLEAVVLEREAVHFPLLLALLLAAGVKLKSGRT